FCDDYLELVKDRAYGAQGDAVAASARATLRISLDVVLRLLAPVLPYVTEEVWSWTHDGSVHRAAWPTVDEVPAGGDAALLTAVGSALAAVRKAKSEAKVGMRAEVPSMTLVGPDAALAHVRAAEADLRAAGKLTGILEFAAGDEVGARDVELVPVAKPTA
ncbi:MAG TPA: class I tRNA ligase family protein, partial [Ornithinibacter sp.]|nr:class I tRNA ligase family protein [Ornithinibacter sp.]